MNEATRKFLQFCLEHKIKRVAIGVKDPTVKSSMDWSSDPSNSVFADKEKDGWPVIWEATRLAGVSGGCGNSGQHQLASDHELTRGCYFHRAGEWKKRIA